MQKLLFYFISMLLQILVIFYIYIYLLYCKCCLVLETTPIHSSFQTPRPSSLVNVQVSTSTSHFLYSLPKTCIYCCSFSIHKNLNKQCGTYEFKGTTFHMWIKSLLCPLWTAIKRINISIIILPFTNRWFDDRKTSEYLYYPAIFGLLPACSFPYF